MALTGRQWGTSVALSENGLAGGEVYTVSMESVSGRRWTAGTYRGAAGATVTATMTCAVSLGKITAVRVVNDVGDVVLSSYSKSTPGGY